MSQKKMTFSELSQIPDGQEPENYYELLWSAFLTESLEAAAKDDSMKAQKKE